MTLHFNFYLSDTDAENLFGIIQNQINRNHIDIQEAIANSDSTKIEALRADNVYIQNLKKRLLNTRITDAPLPMVSCPYIPEVKSDPRQDIDELIKNLPLFPFTIKE